MGYERTASLTHTMESLMDTVRKREQPVTGDLIDLVLRATDSQGAFKEQAWTVDNAGTVTGTKAVT